MPEALQAFLKLRLFLVLARYADITAYRHIRVELALWIVLADPRHALDDCVFTRRRCLLRRGALLDGHARGEQNGEEEHGEDTIHRRTPPCHDGWRVEVCGHRRPARGGRQLDLGLCL